MERKKPIILVVLAHYLPGYKDGGPVRSIKNLTDYLGEEYDIRILTVDRDQKDTKPYENVEPNQWNPVGKAKVWYVPGGKITAAAILEAGKTADMIYMWGCFQDYARKVLFLKKRKKIKIPVVIAPMGMLSPGAFRIKYPKKKLYMTWMKACGMFRNIIWSVTDEQEEVAVRRLVSRKADCRIARDLVSFMGEPGEREEKKKGQLKLVFLSRISPSKNLKYVFEVLRNFAVNSEEKIEFDIYGITEDKDYFKECLQIAEGLPEMIAWEYRGAVSPDEILETFSRYDVLFFPTMSENFGHVIYEAMASGCIPLISDRTPWKELEEKKIGYSIPLEEKQQYLEKLRLFLDMDNQQFIEMRRNALQYAKEVRESVDLEGYRNLFRNISG